MSDTWHRDDYLISTDRSRLNLDLIHKYLSAETYWASGRSRAVVERSIENSFPFGLYQGTEQVGFARVVTDYATFAWIADVFILPEHRGRGLSKWLMQVMIEHPQLPGFREGFKHQHAHGSMKDFVLSPTARRWTTPDPNMKESPDYGNIRIALACSAEVINSG